jgi:hypothetical protein
MEDFHIFERVLYTRNDELTRKKSRFRFIDLNWKDGDHSRDIVSVWIERALEIL